VSGTTSDVADNLVSSPEDDERNDMAKTPKNQGKEWTPADNQQLRKLIKENTPTRVAGLKLDRSPGAVQQHANDLGLSMKPVNQRPNKRGKK
jgi:hypothetical protein